MKKKHILTLVVIIVCAIGMLSATSVEKQSDGVFTFPEKNFETPEAAIKHFVERLAANDLAGAFEACAINEGDCFNYEAYSRRLQAMQPLTSLSPSRYPLFAQINRISNLNWLSRQVKMMLYSLLTDLNENEMSGQTIINPDDKRISSFINSCDSRKISGLTVVKIKLPTAVMNSERARKNAVAQAKCYDADDSTERIILYKLNESYYLGGMYLLKYGKYWRISSLNSNYGNTPLLGNLTKMTSPFNEFDSIGE
jgi:hypothetical protein